MTAYLLQHESTLRLGTFFGILLLMALWETLAPRRALVASKPRRWLSNLGIALLSGLLVRLFIPVSAAAFAVYAQQQSWGVFNRVAVPGWLAILGSMVLLDLVIYLQHVMFHSVPALWRLHRVHHADVDFDVTTGARFHPFEILLSMGIKLCAIALLGPPVIAVVAFEVLLNTMAMFNHSNARLPVFLDRALRAMIVTPDMHRVHHSIEEHETNSNFGFNLSAWDRLFGTYKNQPDAGHAAMTIGIRDFHAPRLVSDLPGMLIIPFLGNITGYAINRRQWGKRP
jgi:sterol desaturase/sphingolipid hydroxylase (fatty acid hydroxylase superfamily)